MRRFNTRLSLWLLGGAAVAAAALFLVHYLQTGRIARALLWQARHAEEQGRGDETARYLGRYLEFAPNDIEEQAHLGRVLADEVLHGDWTKVSYRTRERALFVLEGVVARDPERQDLRRLTARVALALGRPEVARGHLGQLHAALPDDGEVDALMGQCHEAQKEYGDAVLLYWQAICRTPHERDSYIRLALLLRNPDHGQWKPSAEDADQVLQKTPEAVLDLLVANNGGDYKAHLARWAAHGPEELKDAGKRQEAARDVEEALRLAPTEADVLLAAAELARAGGDVPKARAHLREVRERHPDDKRLHLALADLELTDNKPDESIRRIEEGLQVLPDQPDLLWVLANLLIDRKDLERAGQVVARLGKANASPEGLDYLRARMLLVQGRWSEAARILESALPLMERDGATLGLLDQTDLYLAQCYEQTDAPEQRLKAYERIVARETQGAGEAPALVQAVHGRAQVLAAVGRLDEAVAQYQDLVKRKDAPKGARVELARLLMARNLTNGQRDWTDIEAQLKEAAAQKDDVDGPLLRARLRILARDWDGARQILEQARKDFPGRVEPWAALVEVAELQKQPEEVARLVREAGEQQEDSALRRLARLHAWAGAPEKERGPFPVDLAAGLDRFAAEDQTYLLHRLVEVAYQKGKVAEALPFWQQLAAMPEHLHDLRIKVVLIELALKADNEAALAQTLQDVQQIEGGQGPVWSYGEALRLLRPTPKKPDPATLDRAAVLLGFAAAERPGWAAAHLALADLEQLRNNPDQAINHYQKAVALNEHSPRVLQQLARLLDQHGRSGEAAQVLRALAPQDVASADLQWMAADLALRNHDPARAVQLALAAVAPGSTDYHDYLRRGLVLAADPNKRSEAEADLRHATDLGGDKPETWIALVAFLAGTQQTDAARKSLEAARTRLPADLVPLTLAQCWAQLGDSDRAREQYREAVKQKPADFGTCETAAAFYLRFGPPEEAEALLRPLVTGEVKFKDSEVAWARQQLAELLSGYPDEAHFTEALSLLGMKLADGKVVADNPAAVSPDEQRTRARVLATRPRRACRTEAIALLEALSKSAPLAAEDQFILARLYEADGAQDRARSLLTTLAANSGDNPIYLLYLARGLLRQNEVNEAEHYVEQLEEFEKERKVERGTYGSVELRAHVWEAHDQGQQALELVQAYVKRKGARPEDVFVLIACLVRQKKYDEALDTCDRAWGTCPPEAAGRVSLGALHAFHPTAEQFRRVEERLQKARAGDRGTVLLMYLADLFEIQENYPKAEDCYRQVLARDENNVAALNNLAWLLAQTNGNKDDALKLIQRAIERQGDVPDFLDTRAVVEMGKSQADAAVRDLEQANADQPTASRTFRLAQAYYLANNRDKALEALRRAKSSGLKPEDLHPTEQMAFRKVNAELDPQ
jgi:tetratricopeptide (TPR) repeat protein